MLLPTNTTCTPPPKAEEDTKNKFTLPYLPKQRRTCYNIIYLTNFTISVGFQNGPLGLVVLYASALCIHVPISMYMYMKCPLELISIQALLTLVTDVSEN